MELVLVNSKGTFRRAVLADREHLVVPMTMLVPGVLAGSNGPLYYSPAELARTVDAWNGMDVVAPSHPTDALGNNVSARSPGVLEKYGVGRVYNARIRPRDGALVGEAWLDVQNTRAKYPQLLDAVLAGRKVELSTGLYTTNRPVLNGRCPRTGREYQLEAVKHRPDHLAILLNESGACSLRDGCGLGVNAAAKKSCCTACKTGKPCEGKDHAHDHDKEKPAANCGGVGGKPGPCPSKTNDTHSHPIPAGKVVEADAPVFRASKDQSGTPTEAAGGHQAIGAGVYLGHKKEDVSGYGPHVHQYKVKGKLLEVAGDKEMDKVKDAAKVWAAKGVAEHLADVAAGKAKMDVQRVVGANHMPEYVRGYLESHGLTGIRYKKTDPVNDHHDQTLVFRPHHLTANCGGPGSGVPGPCPSGSDHHSGLTSDHLRKMAVGEKLTAGHKITESDAHDLLGAGMPLTASRLPTVLENKLGIAGDRAREIIGKMTPTGTIKRGPKKITTYSPVELARHAGVLEEKPTGNWCNQHGGTTCKGGAKAAPDGPKLSATAKTPGKGARRAALQAERDQYLAHAHDVLSGKLPATDEHLGRLAHGLSRLTSPQVKALREKFAQAKTGKGIKAEHVEAVKQLALKRKVKPTPPGIDPKKTEVVHKPGVGTIYQDKPTKPPKPKKGLLHRIGRAIGRVAGALDVVGNASPPSDRNELYEWADLIANILVGIGVNPNGLTDNYRPDQPRDKNGRFGSGGFSHHADAARSLLAQHAKSPLSPEDGAKLSDALQNMTVNDLRTVAAEHGMTSVKGRLKQDKVLAISQHLVDRYGSPKQPATHPTGAGLPEFPADDKVYYAARKNVPGSFTPYKVDDTISRFRALEKSVKDAPDAAAIHSAIKDAPVPGVRTYASLLGIDHAGLASHLSYLKFGGADPGTAREATHHVYSGNTYEHRKRLAAAGGVWNPEAKTWVVSAGATKAHKLYELAGLTYTKMAVNSLSGGGTVTDAALAALLDLGADGDRRTLRRLARYVTNAAPPDADALAAVSKRLAGKGAMRGYGQVFRNGGHVWYVGGDGDERPAPLFNAVPGVTGVMVTADVFPPFEQGWELVYPVPTVNAKGKDKGGKLTGGRWVTTDDGNKLYLKGGRPVAGNPHVVAGAKKAGPGKAGGGKKGKPAGKDRPHAGIDDKTLDTAIKEAHAESGCSVGGGKGKCSEVSVSLWDKLGRPEHLTPHGVSLTKDTDTPGADHVVLLDKRTGDVIDPTGYQYGKKTRTSKADSGWTGWRELPRAELDESRKASVGFLRSAGHLSKAEHDARIKKITDNAAHETDPSVLAANLWSEAARAAAAVARRLHRKAKVGLRKAGRTAYAHSIGSLVSDVKDGLREIRDSKTGKVIGTISRGIRADVKQAKKSYKVAKRLAEHKLRKIAGDHESAPAERKRTARVVRGTPVAPPTRPLTLREKRARTARHFQRNADGSFTLLSNPHGCNQHTGAGCSGSGGGARDLAFDLRASASRATGRAFDASFGAMKHGTPHALLTATEAARKLARRAQAGVGSAGGTHRHHRDAAGAHMKASEAHTTYSQKDGLSLEAVLAHTDAALAHLKAYQAHDAVASHLARAGPLTGTHHWDTRPPVHNGGTAVRMYIDGRTVSVPLGERVLNCGGKGGKPGPCKTAGGGKHDHAAIAAALHDAASGWVGTAHGGGTVPDKVMTDTVARIVGTASPKKVAAALGHRRKFATDADAMKAIHQTTIGRYGSFVRAGV